MNTLRTTSIAGVCALVILSTAACGASGEDSSSAASVAQSSSTPTATAAASGTTAGLRAVRTAVKRVSGARSYDLEREDGRRPGWEVKVSGKNGRAHEFRTDLSGRRVLRSKRVRFDNDAKDSRKVKVGITRAISTAARRSSLRLDQAELERQRGGRLVWEVTFEGSRDRETEVIVDATSGKVLRVKHDD